MIAKTTLKPLTALLIGASSLAIAMPAHAQELVFADNPDLAAAALRGERVSQTSGVMQLRLPSGAMLSFVEGAEFQLRPDGSVDLFKGNVTVAGAAKGDTLVRLADQGTAKITGSGSSGSFSVGTDRNGKPMATGRVLTGLAAIANGREEKRFLAGQAWEVANGHPRLAMSAPVAPSPRPVLAKAPVTPSPVEPAVVPITSGGPAAAAQNGVPVVLGEALAAAGAAGDIVSAGQRIEAAVTNPTLETFPSGDLAALVGYAAQIERLYGGTPFDQAQADIIRAYLGYLANGGSQAQFLSVYAGFMVQFLDLVRSGAAPSSFSGTTLADINAFLSYQSRSDALSGLSSQNRVLVDAYLAFIQQGGNADLFASRYTSLTAAYFAFLRSGGDPLAFEGATQETLNAYIAFLNQSGLLAQLAEADRTLLQAYLANGGAAFIAQYRTALDAYFAYLSSGNLPSEYAAINPAVLRQYLETLQSSGLFAQVLGDRAEFFASYLAYLKQGGTIDGWQGLPANTYASYADALSAYAAYLQAGGVPSAYSGADLALLQQYLKALIDSGKLGSLLAGQAEFLSAYYAYLAGGGSADGYAGLPVYANYVSALEAYYAYLAAGGTPSAYTALTQAQILAYLKALTDSGVLASLFSGETLAFIEDFYLYLANGGNPDQFAGLPGGGGGGGGGTPQEPVAYVANAEATLIANPVTADVDTAGKITRLRFTHNGSALDFNYASNPSNEAKEFGHFGDDVAWTRYLDNTANDAINFNSHLLTGTPSATIPASGKIDYRLVGGTAPTDFHAPEGEIGTFTGSLAVAFGSAPAVGLAMDVVAGSRSWHVQTAGGSADPSNGGLLIGTDRSFAGTSANLTTTSTSGGGCSATCATSLNGNLFGQDAAYAAFVYTINDKSVPDPNLVNGLAVFGRSGTTLDHLGNAPSSGGGGGTSSAYAGGFTATSGLNLYVAAQETSGWNSGQSAVVGSDGSFTGSIRNVSDTSRFTDLAGDASGVIGRIYDGTFSVGNTQVTYGLNNGLAYALMAPISGSLPISGSISYDLLAATSPIYTDGHTAPGTFSANLRIGFGAVLTYAMDGTITMPDATYTFSTPGGASGALQAAQVGNNPQFLVIRPTLSATGPACANSGCFVNFYGGFGGATPENRLGFGYVTVGGTSDKQIAGAALFGKEGTLPTDSGTGTVSPRLTNATTLTMVDGGTSAFTAQEVDVGTTGSISRIKLNSSSTTSYGPPSVLKERGRVGDTVAWSRWDNTTTNANLNPNSHLITGTPAVSLPASGKVDYAIVGSTAPTNFNGADGQSGTVSGSLAVEFGSQAKVGFNLDVNTGPRGWTIATAGGASDPSNGGLVVGNDMRFGSASVGITPLNASSCLSSCNASVVGALYGTGASHVGLGYQISDFAPTGAFTVNGAAVFGKAQP